MKYSYKEYKEFINLTLEQKEIWSNQLIAYALKNSKTHSISCSWGKGSIAMLALVRKLCKNSKVIFANTKVEYPETYKYRDEMLTSVFKNIDYCETEPIKSFWDCVKEFGFPHNRQSAEQDKKGEKKRRTPMCCNYLKELPLKHKQKELGVDTTFIGLQATESMNRRLVFMRMGAYYYQKHDKVYRCLPLAIWTDEDIFTFLKRENIPLCEVYKKMKRNGCMFCTGFKNWEKVMQGYNANLYAGIIRKKEGQTVLGECNL